MSNKVHIGTLDRKGISGKGERGPVPIQYHTHLSLTRTHIRHNFVLTLTEKTNREICHDS